MTTHSLRKSLILLLGLLLVLQAAQACRRATVPPPPPVTWPSVVVTQDGTAYYVRGVRIPGTRQELRLKGGETMTWVPLSLVQQLRFTGPIQEGYRPAQITLTSGERIKGPLFVEFLLEGETDLGYWVTPMSKVERLEMGTE